MDPFADLRLRAAASRARARRQRKLRNHLATQRQARAAAVEAKVDAPPTTTGGPQIALPAKVARRAVPPTETARVVSLPARDYFGADLNSTLRRKDAPEDAPFLWPDQSAALAAIHECQGGLIGLAVGAGKAFIALLSRAVLGADVGIVLAPARTLGQLRQTCSELQRAYPVGHLRFLSYTQLSNDRPAGPNDLELLELLAKNSDRVVVVADEAHAFANPRSGRTRKITRFFQTHPQHYFVALSGTLTSKSLREFSHIAGLALRHLSPVPRAGHHLDAWAETIDVDGQPGEQHWSVVQPLWREYHGNAEARGQQRKKLIRQAFQQRLRSSAGVVMSTEGSLGTSLVISARKVEVPVELQAKVDAAKVDDADLNGEIFVDDVSRWRFARQISAGFWYRWIWPGGIPDAAWLFARSAWRRAVAYELGRRGRKGYDTPKQVEDHARATQRGGLYHTLLAWDAQRRKPEPPVEAVWESPYLVDDAVTFALSIDEPVIVWYESKAIGDALRGRLPTFGAGDDVPTHLLLPGAEGVTCAMSWRAQATGLNLQHGWSRNLVLEPPPGNKAWEQMLGRTHRPLQQADEVVCWVYQHTDSYRKALTKAREQASYVEDTSGARQKLCYAVYEITGHGGHTGA